MSEKREELLDAVNHACLQLKHMNKPFEATQMQNHAAEAVIEHNRRKALRQIDYFVQA